MFHSPQGFGSVLRPGKGGKPQPALAHLPKAGSRGAENAAALQQAVEPAPAVLGIRAIRTADPEVGGQAAGTAGGTGEPQLVKHLQHGGGILPVEGKGLLPLPQSGGGKGGLRGPLDGIAGAIAVAAQPALPGCGAAGFPRQDDPAAPDPGKAVGFGCLIYA